MISINLLDWRSQVIKINNNKFFVIAGAVAIVSMMASSVLIYLFLAVTGDKKGDINYLNNQISEVESKIVKIKGLQAQKNSLLERRKAIEDLQNSRPMVVKLFDSLARVIPEGVIFNSITRDGDNLTITGDSESNVQISNLMKNVQKLSFVKTAELSEIKAAVSSSKEDATVGPDQINFELKITFVPLPGMEVKNESK